MPVTDPHSAEQKGITEREVLVRVKLCGNCNPFTDAGKILNALRRADNLKLLFGDDGECDVLLFINGCDRACTASAARSAGLVVNGWKFQGAVYTDESKLAAAVARALMKHS